MQYYYVQESPESVNEQESQENDENVNESDDRKEVSQECQNFFYL